MTRSLFCKRPMRSESFEEGRVMKERTKGTQRVFSWVADAVMWFVSLHSVSAIAKAVKYGVVLPLRRGGAR